MYKTKVQELCQKRSWSLPDYETTRDGPDHNPRFTAAVTVSGIRFETQSPCRSSKEAQNNAAMLAFHHLSSQHPSLINPSPPPFPPKPKFMLRPKPKPNNIPVTGTPTLPGLDSFPQPTFVPALSSFPPPPSRAPATHCAPGASTAINNILPTSAVLPQKLEEGCQISQVTSPVTAARDSVITGDRKSMAHLYKNQLQSFAQKQNLQLPVYTSEWEGPPHAMRFKCKVMFDGQTYESPNFFSTLKDAEHAAAEVALLSLLPGGFQEDSSVLYKNLLQELIQKEGFNLPSYTTERSGEPHIPTFLSHVEVEGEVFTGQEAKTKKQAEMNAAKVAYITLKERKGKSEQRSLLPLSDHTEKAPEPDSLPDFSDSTVKTDLQPHSNPKYPVIPGAASTSQPNKNKEPVVTKKKGSSASGFTNGNGMKDSSSSDVKPAAAAAVAAAAPSLSDSKNVASNINNMPSTASGSPGRKKRVVVYSRDTNVKVEGGGTLMPISDEKWVAYKYSQ